METLNPRFSVQNTDSGKLLASFEHVISENEVINFTVLIPKAPNQTLADAIDAAVVQAAKLLDQLHDAHMKNK